MPFYFSHITLTEVYCYYNKKSTIMNVCLNHLTRKAFRVCIIFAAEQINQVPHPVPI